MASIDLTGTWGAAALTQADLHDVNRPGYQGKSKAAPTTYKVTFDKNASTATGSQEAITIAKGSKVAMPTCTYTNSGKTFQGWNTQADGAGTNYTVGQMVAVSKATTLYAKWSA